MNFRGKSVWVTGASSGIGEALARGLAQRGCRLILSSRRETELRRVAGLCSGAQDVTVLAIDLSRPETMRDAAEQALTIAGHIDVLVHNGGISQRSYARDTAFEVDDLLMRTNYLGPVALTKAILPAMLARRNGHFVVVSSILGKLAIPSRSGYCASKHALHGFFNALRAELWLEGIQVTLAVPGFVRTNISINALTGDGTALGKMEPDTAAGISPESCAERILAAAARGDREIVIGRLKEQAAVYMSRLTPRLFARLVRKR
ncbi:MAG TPA: SDR family oxidoreductase [Terriglobia bacterium]|nr:SDR family oxidoreductase [Terriglobia bacterium]